MEYCKATPVCTVGMCKSQIYIYNKLNCLSISPSPDYSNKQREWSMDGMHYISKGFENLPGDR